MTKQYHLRNIRNLLTEGFTDEELRRFCYDMPEFRPVYDQLAQTSGKTEIIDRLIEYADRKLQVELLLALAKEQNPARYEEYRPYRIVAKSSQSADLVEQTQAIEDPINRFERLHDECYKEFTKLERELILLASIIVDAWFEFSQEKNGYINNSIFFRPEVREDVADYIIEKLLADPRTDDHTDIETIRSAPPALQKVLAKQVLHFDQEVFVNREQPWSLVRNSSNFSPFGNDHEQVFNKIIPSQFVTAMSEFALQWTNDVENEDRDRFFEYLVSKYGMIEETNEDCKMAWKKWNSSLGRLKCLVFYERVWILSHALFFRRESSVMDSHPLIIKAAKSAFEGRDGAQCFLV
jgi:hypothetical protein